MDLAAITCDRAIINQYADEVEDLSRIEVNAANSPGAEALTIRLMEFGGILRKTFKPEPSSLFDELIDALNAQVSPSHWKLLQGHGVYLKGP